jgi:hypothetical protein
MLNGDGFERLKVASAGLGRLCLKASAQGLTVSGGARGLWRPGAKENTT